MKYEYKCVNIQCIKRNEIIEINKPMSEAGKSEYCEECGESLQKIFGSPGLRTSGSDKNKI